jgi:hypothetical protein
VLPRLFRRERPGGRLLVLQEAHSPEQPIVLSEFGGIAYSADPRAWGYWRCESPADLGHLYSRLLTAVRSLAILSGFCYTQFADTYQEANGLLRADRTPKFSIAEIARATRGQAADPKPVVNPLEAVGLTDQAP